MDAFDARNKWIEELNCLLSPPTSFPSPLSSLLFLSPSFHVHSQPHPTHRVSSQRPFVLSFSTITKFLPYLGILVAESSKFYHQRTEYLHLHILKTQGKKPNWPNLSHVSWLAPLLSTGKICFCLVAPPVPTITSLGEANQNKAGALTAGGIKGYSKYRTADVPSVNC